MNLFDRMSVLSAGVLALSLQGASAAVSVPTQHNDNYRSGMNLHETMLNVTNVNSTNFGPIGAYDVDDQIYAQPLVATNVNVAGKGLHNIVIVATVNDSVYAFDADNLSVSNAYWHATFLSGTSVAPQNSNLEDTCGSFTSHIGIIGTPVIDPADNAVYVVGMTYDNGTALVQRLHALSLSTGAELAGSPVVISATCPGSTSDSVGGVITFNPATQNQRPALTLADGVVYIAWSSFCDTENYHGWVLGYNTADLAAHPIVFNDTTQNSYTGGGQAGIWMSGTGLAADSSGDLYVATGNGAFDGDKNFGECFLKLTPGTTNLSVTSWFAPWNWNTYNEDDLDVGTGGIMLVTNTSLLVGTDKSGNVYAVNRNDMGGVSAGTLNTNIVQSWSIGNQSHGGPAWWDGPGSSWLYIWASKTSALQQFDFNRTTGFFDTNDVAESSWSTGNKYGGILAVSANGAAAGTGIVWAIAQGSSDPYLGILHAFNAQNVSEDLWDSTNTSDELPKWVAPTVANGKVYVATFSNLVRVYGLYSVPPLSYGTSGGHLVLRWPEAGSAGCTLQWTANLITGPWANVTNAVTQSNGTNSVTVTCSESPGAFFRLMR